MDFKDFRIGEKYNISALAIEGSFAMKKYAVFKLPTGRIFLLRAEDFEAVSPENGIKNTEPAPKYDPCRLFRKGDKAKPRIINGREIPKMPLDVIFTVTGDEDEYGAVPVEYMSPVRGLLTSTTVLAVWLELVTPVEEQEPYFVEEGQISFRLKKGDKLLANYWPSHPNAKAAAEAERDRLNAEYRKEQK